MIDLRDLSIRAGAFALDGVSLHVPAGTYAALMGPTGAGKTTLLEAVCGLRPVVAGTVRTAASGGCASHSPRSAGSWRVSKTAYLPSPPV